MTALRCSSTGSFRESGLWYKTIAGQVAGELPHFGPHLSSSGPQEGSYTTITTDQLLMIDHACLPYFRTLSFRFRECAYTMRRDPSPLSPTFIKCTERGYFTAVIKRYWVSAIKTTCMCITETYVLVFLRKK